MWLKVRATSNGRVGVPTGQRGSAAALYAPSRPWLTGHRRNWPMDSKSVFRWGHQWNWVLSHFWSKDTETCYWWRAQKEEFIRLGDSRGQARPSEN